MSNEVYMVGFSEPPPLSDHDNKKWLYSPNSEYGGLDEGHIFVHLALSGGVQEVVMAKGEYNIMKYNVGGGLDRRPSIKMTYGRRWWWHVHGRS
jgi:hypothetical protein